MLQAAVTVARRVAFEKKVDLGQEVGYAVRFEERTCRRTRIKYLTGEEMSRKGEWEAISWRRRLMGCSWQLQQVQKGSVPSACQVACQVG